MSNKYRIEISPNNRAGCNDTVCKNAKAKCTKGTLRFGTWVEVAQFENASWKWKHWGCVSGAQLEGLRTAIERDGEYDFDLIDGFDELGDHPEHQEKIRRAMIEGKIADEDFNGDPEYNVLGQKGIRGRARVRKPNPEDEEEGGNADGASAPKTPAKKTPAKKRGRKEAAGDDGEDAIPLAKKAKVKKQADDEDAHVENEPEVEQPKRKVRASKKVKAESEVEPEVEPEVEQPKKKVRASKKVKAEPEADDDQAAAEPEVPKKKARASKKPKAEPEADNQIDAKAIPEKPKRKSRAKKITEPEPEPEPTPEPELESAEEDNGDSDFDDEEEPKPAPKKRGGRKKTAANGDDAIEAKAPKKRSGRKKR